MSDTNKDMRDQSTEYTEETEINVSAEAMPSENGGEKGKGKKKSAPFIIRMLQGMIIGVGGILPGISGGVFCAVFGLYQYVMEFLAHPIKRFKTHMPLLMPVGIGLVIGFLGLAKLVEGFFTAYEQIATCLFTGLIAGMLPSMWKEAGDRGRKKSSYISMAVMFAVLFGIFLVIGFLPECKVVPNKWWFLFSGVLFGLGIVVPGMSCSSTLIFLGLYEPLLGVISSFLDNGLGFVGGKLSFSEALAGMQFVDGFAFFIGVVAIFVAIPKFINMLIDRRPSELYHAIFGAVGAMTLPILIFTIKWDSDILIKLASLAVGFVLAIFIDKFNRKFAAD